MNRFFWERLVASVLIILLVLIAGLLEPKSLIGAIPVALLMLVTCSPNLDPVAMRVSTVCTAGKEAAHEGQTAFAGTDHCEAA